MEDPPLTVILTDSAVGDLESIDEYWASRDEPERGQQYVRDLIRMAEFTLSDLQQAKLGRAIKMECCRAQGKFKLTASSASYTVLKKSAARSSFCAIGMATAILPIGNFKTDSLSESPCKKRSAHS